MADAEETGASSPSTEPAAAEPKTPPTRRSKKVTAAAPAAEASPSTEITPAAAEESTPRAPKRATLDASTRRALQVRRDTDRRRPLFVRQAAHRYWRIGRDDSWRRPRGLQSKQRRHYGYRSEIVSVGYRSPAKARGLVPSGFRPVIVRTATEIARVDSLKEAIIIARTVGTRRRLALEEAARRLGVHILNPIATPDTEE